MAAERHDPIGSTVSGGRYAITAKLGQGGMGTVYRARDNNISADVVIKLPHRSMVTDAEFSRRFREEIRSLVRLSHPHIVKVTDVGEWDGIPFAVLQFLSGGSLEDRQATWKGPISLTGLGSWLEPVARALDYVHSQGMVHRDVKPANILFDEQGHAFLGDFGVVKVLAAVDDRSNAAMTGAGMVLGTPYYMAPELVMGDPFDGRVDQYALAVAVYELLCGRRPFEHSVSTRVLMMQTRDLPPSMAGHSPWIPAGLEEALLMGLAKDPAARYASCSAFASAVVEATGIRPGEQAPRARIRCGSCGQTIKVAAESLAKLARSGKSAPCPHCKASLNLETGTASVLPAPTPGRPASGPTRVLDIRGSSAEMKTSRPTGTLAIDTGTGNKTVAIPRPSADATVAINLGQGAKTVAIPRPAGSGTVAIDTGRGSKTVAIPRPEWATAEPSGTGKAAGAAALSWLPLGLAAAASAVVAGAGVFWMTASGSSAKSRGAGVPRTVAEGSRPASPNPSTVTPTRPEAPAPAPGAAAKAASAPLSPRDQLSGFGVPDRTADEPEPSTAPAPPKPAARPGLGPLASRTPAPRGRAARNKTEADREASSAGTVESLGNRPDPEPIVADDEQPSRLNRNVQLKKLLASPEAFAGMLITLEQTYALGKTPWRMPDGSLHIALIESDLEIFPNMRMCHGEEFEIGLDRRLAEQLIGLKKLHPIAGSKPSRHEWIIHQPSNLYVKVADEPGRGGGPIARIVRLEMYKRFGTEINKSRGVRLETETVTQSGSKETVGHDDEWSRVHKFHHAYDQFKDMKLANKRKHSMAQQHALDSMIGAQMNAAAAAFANGQNAAVSRMSNSLGFGR